MQFYDVLLGIFYGFLCFGGLGFVFGDLGVLFGLLCQVFGLVVFFVVYGDVCLVQFVLSGFYFDWGIFWVVGVYCVIYCGFGYGELFGWWVVGVVGQDQVVVYGQQGQFEVMQGIGVLFVYCFLFYGKFFLIGMLIFWFLFLVIIVGVFLVFWFFFFVY